MAVPTQSPHVEERMDLDGLDTRLSMAIGGTQTTVVGSSSHSPMDLLPMILRDGSSTISVRAETELGIERRVLLPRL